MPSITAALGGFALNAWVFAAYLLRIGGRATARIDAAARRPPRRC